MPRSLRCAPSLISFVALLSLHAAPAAFAGSALAAGTVPIIHAIDALGMAPFAVHVHGLNSSLGLGNETTARYEWDFGDPAGDFNTLVGWNAAHLYRQPGTYSVKLTITDQAGSQASTMMQVTVAADTRTPIYVSPSGSDANSGGSPGAAVRTVGRAGQLLGSNKAVYFERNGVYDTSASLTVSQSNVLVGAYGSGAKPVLRCTSTNPYMAIIGLGASAVDAVIQDLDFTSIFAPTKSICRGVEPTGTNITVAGCHFGNVSYATNGDPVGFLLMNNVTDVIGAYFAWVEGSDVTIIGNVAGDSVEEHNIRLGGAQRVLIESNSLTNISKSTVWCMLGDHAYVANNTLISGRFMAGPNPYSGAASDRFKYAVFDCNHIIGEGCVISPGAEHIVVRNNIFNHDAGECASVWGYYAPMDRTCIDITIANNTGTNNSTVYGKFLSVGDGVQGLLVAGNLYDAPAVTLLGGGGNVVSQGASLAGQAYRDNLWAKPLSGLNVHSVGGAARTISLWDAYAETSNESYRSFQPGDLDGSYVPQFAPPGQQPVPGVLTDYYGHLRSASGTWTAGAVEIGSGPPSGDAADVNHDGLVNIDDVLLVAQSWGMCPGGSCDADANGDGAVDIDDLLTVLTSW